MKRIMTMLMGLMVVSSAVFAESSRHEHRVRTRRDPVVRPERKLHRPTAAHRSRTNYTHRSRSVFDDWALRRSIERRERHETRSNQLYWHREGGHRFAHRVRSGVHWYGFSTGTDFYWTRLHRNRWWRYDQQFGQWVFWSNGYWWWNSPSGVAWVHQNDSYYPFDVAPVTVSPPNEHHFLASDPEPNSGRDWKSADGRRMVQIHGPMSEAFLYDNSGTEPIYLAYLAKDVVDAQFDDGGEGRFARIRVECENGDVLAFTMDGKPVNGRAPVQTEPVIDEARIGEPPAPPTDIPN